MLEFKIIDEALSPYDSKIECTGLTSQFTINEVLDHKEYTEKKLREAKGQIDADRKQMELIEKLFPGVKDIPAHNYEMVVRYIANQEQIKQLEDLEKTCQATLDSYDERLELITEQLGIEMPVKVDYVRAEPTEETHESPKATD